MLSASADPLGVARSYSLGANAYAVKPVAFEQLVKTLAGVCGFWLELNVQASTSAGGIAFTQAMGVFPERSSALLSSSTG